MLRLWELNFEISRHSDTSIHLQIAQIISQAIQSGRLASGYALPGSRALSDRIAVNRKTVVQAYDALIAQGWLITEYKRGTFVAPNLLGKTNVFNKTNLVDKSNVFSKASGAGTKNTFNQSSSNTDFLSKKQPLLKPAVSNNHSQFTHQNNTLADGFIFSDGLPDSRLMPFMPISRAMRHALITTSRNSQSGWGDARGHHQFRAALAEMLNFERGLNVNTEEICVVRGSQMGIYVAVKQCIHLGDYVVIEQLCNMQARQAFIASGARILEVAHDEDGIDLTHLALLCQQQKIRAVYIAPNHQIPTTVQLSMQKKSQLLKLAQLYDFLIIEDDNDYAFNFNSVPEPSNHNPHAINFPIASLPHHQRVILIGGLSNVLGADFRHGYIVADAHTVQACGEIIASIDQQGDQIAELAMAELLNTGEIKKHIRRCQPIYSERRQLFAALLTEELGDFIHFNLPNSGLAFWLQMHTNRNITQLINDTARHQIQLSMGNTFSALSHLQIPAMRIGFANLNPDEMRLGINKLKNVFKLHGRMLLRA